MIQPVKDYLLIKVDQPKDQTDSGILISQKWKDLPPSGTILSVGKEVKEPLLKEGNRVIFGRYSSIEADIDDPDLRLVREHAVWAVING